MTPEEILSWEPFLKRIPLLAGLSSSEISRVASRMQLLSLPKGSTLYSQGDEGDALYIIASGQARKIAHDQGGETVIGFLGRGDTLGEIGLLTGERRTSTARLDTTCEFLKLLRKDFEEVLRENPSILLHLSRTISRRLVENAKAPQKVRTGGPQMIVLNAALSRGERLLFALHLSLRLMEQTRRRTLLVDMGPDAGAVVQALGLKPAIITEALLREVNLRDPAGIRALVQEHPSGLDILSLPAGNLGGRLYSGIYLFLNFLRDAHDLVLVNLGNELGDVERSVLAEADQAVLVGAEALRPQFRQMQSEIGALVDQKKMLQVWLGEVDPEAPVFSFGAQQIALPWSEAVVDAFERTGSPHQALEAEPKAMQGLERLARKLGGIKVGLALGTGAALGHSMIGIMKVFKRERIPVDIIAGTSVGALVAGFIALGMEPEEIEEIALRIDKAWVYENLFWDMTLPRSGLFAGQSLLRFIHSYFGTKEFGDLEIPFACVATDIETGEEVVLREGHVAESIRASCGLPLIFKPLHLNGRYLVDGGLVNPVPTRVIAEMGADIILAVSLTMPAGERNVASKKKPHADPKSLFHLPVDLQSIKDFAMPDALKTPNMLEVFFQMIYTMEYEIAQSRTSPAHVVIHPDLAGFSWTELHRAKDLIAMGERIAQAYAPQIKALLPYFSEEGRAPRRAS